MSTGFEPKRTFSKIASSGAAIFEILPQEVAGSERRRPRKEQTGGLRLEWRILSTVIAEISIFRDLDRRGESCRPLSRGCPKG